jgi:hypothetical protein
MNMQEELREQSREERARKRALVEAVEARRTPRDRNYALTIDSFVSKASKETDAVMGERPPARDPLRRMLWDNEWTRKFHQTMDDIAIARGLRCLSHQA